MESVRVLLPLPSGETAFVSLKDAPWLSLRKWYSSGRYAQQFGNGGHNPTTHRTILGLKDPNRLVDHIDGNGLNNCRANLRDASHSQNQMNRPSYGGSSKYKGVCWDKERSKWVAIITLNGKQHKLGRFTDEIEAAAAYNEAAKKYFGEFAYLNDLPAA